MTGTSPPGPFRCGSTTCSVKAGADRKRGGEGKRVDFGGGRIIKKKKKKETSCLDHSYQELPYHFGNYTSKSGEYLDTFGLACWHQLIILNVHELKDRRCDTIYLL